MSGHSKWSTIKRQKGKNDAERAKIYTKIGRELAIAVKEGGGNPETNSRLRDAIAKAKSNNMPNDNIQRAIKKASGELGTVNYEEITYEGYAPGGVAVIVEVVTDNRNRSAAEVRHIFDKYGGSMGNSGCVAWMFDKKGLLFIEKTPDMDEDSVMMDALDAGADDVEISEEGFEITTEMAAFSPVRDALEGKGYSFITAELAMIPQNIVEPDLETAEKINVLLGYMEDYDDVQEVYHNAQLPEEME